jgi:Recombination endonuclease VII
MKNCTFCKQLKPLSEYHVYRSGPRKGKIWSQCKECRKTQLYEWRKAKPEKYALLGRRARFKAKYRLDEADVPSFGECPICLKEKKLVVDHCHTHGHVRGFICYNCNTLLGHIENEDKMSRVTEYLQNKRALNVPIV